MAEWHSGVFSFFNKDVQNIAGCDLVMCRYLIYPNQYVFAKCLNGKLNARTEVSVFVTWFRKI